MCKFLFPKKDRIPNDMYFVSGDSIFGCSLFGHTKKEAVRKMAMYFEEYLPISNKITITREGEHPTKGYYYIYIQRG